MRCEGVSDGGGGEDCRGKVDRLIVPPGAELDVESDSSFVHFTPTCFLTSVNSTLGARTRCELAPASIAKLSGSKSNTRSLPFACLTVMDACREGRSHASVAVTRASEAALRRPALGLGDGGSS